MASNTLTSLRQRCSNFSAQRRATSPLGLAKPTNTLANISKYIDEAIQPERKKMYASMMEGLCG